MATPLEVLLVASAELDPEPLADALIQGGFEPSWTRVDSRPALLSELARPRVQIILFESSLRRIDVTHALKLASGLAPDVPFVIIAAPTPDDAVPLMQAGAADFVTAQEMARLPAVVMRELRQAATRRARRAAEGRFQSLIERAPLGVLVHSDLRILYANPTCLRYVRAGHLEDLVGRDPLELVVEGDRPRLRERILRIQAGQTLPPAETELVRKDGTTVPIEVVGFQLDVEGGPAVVSLARDISAEREMQQRLLIADRMASIGTLAAGVAHEMNNPLSFVHANVEFALEALSGRQPDAKALEDARAALYEARQGTSRVRLIVRDLRTFSRSDEESVAIVDLRHVVESAINIAFNEIRYRARLVKQYGPLPLVEANGEKLGQVFLNLLVNAAQAIPEGAPDRNEIRVSAWTDERGRGVVSVADTGAGIAPEVRGRIFEPFFTTKPVGQGTGLGLTICERIVNSLGGEIVVSSEPGRGAEFRVALPPAPPETRPAAPDGAEPEEGGGRRILVIDDDPLVQASIQRVLSRHDVEAEVSARRALQGLAAGRRYDAILCDLTMTEMSGMELHAELMKIDPAQASRMIFLLSGRFTPAAQRFLDRVPNLRLEKPFNSSDLRALVRTQLG